jgi:hypothetical protein
VFSDLIVSCAVAAAFVAYVRGRTRSGYGGRGTRGSGVSGDLRFDLIIVS